MNTTIKTLLSEWKKYSTDKEVLMRTDIPEGVPILTFAGFISWLQASYLKKGEKDS